MKRLERIYREAARMIEEYKSDGACMAIADVVKWEFDYDICPEVKLFKEYFKPRTYIWQLYWMQSYEYAFEQDQDHRVIALLTMAAMCAVQTEKELWEVRENVKA